jgi:hypothetical protein
MQAVPVESVVRAKAGLRGLAQISQPRHGGLGRVALAGDLAQIVADKGVDGGLAFSRIDARGLQFLFIG